MNSCYCRGQERPHWPYSSQEAEILSEVPLNGLVIQKQFVRVLFSTVPTALMFLAGLDYPYILSLLPNNTIEAHSVETQVIAQVIGAPVTSPPPSKPSSPVKPSMHQRSASSTSRDVSIGSSRRVNLMSSIGGYLVPSTQRSEKMRTVPVKLLRS